MSNEFHGTAMEPPKRKDPVKQLACAVLFLALEDLGAAGTDRHLDARRFLFGKSTDYLEARTYWMKLAGLPLDCLERFKDFNAPRMKAHMRALAADRRGRSA